jgi:glycosyltransferase involved in cell wall biosynthesis
MNVLFSSLSGQDLTQTIPYLRVLKRLGHQVFRITVPSLKEDLCRGFWVEAGFSPETTLEALIRLSGFEPDLFLYIEPNGLIPRGMEEAPFPTVCILCDTHRLLSARLNLARFFDHVFLYHRNYLHYFNEHPPGNVHWHPYACDLEFFHPLGVERDLDVAFIGQLHPDSERFRILSVLLNRYKMNEQRYYLQEEIPAIYSRAKIVLNLPLADDLNFRTFEAMSCGAMLLTRRVSNGQELLFKEGIHFEAFGDGQELLDKVEYYLSHPEERESIATAGLTEVQQRHRLEQRIEELLNIVGGYPNKVAPIRRMTSSKVDKQYAWLYEYWRTVEPGLKLVRKAREAGRPWLLLLLPVIRSMLRVVFR